MTQPPAPPQAKTPEPKTPEPKIPEPHSPEHWASDANAPEHWASGDPGPEATAPDDRAPRNEHQGDYAGPQYGPFHRADAATTVPPPGSPVAPTSGHPAELDAYGLPVSPTSGGGRFGMEPVPGDPFGVEPVPGDPFGFDTSMSRGPRIEPSPPPQRGKFLLGAVTGLLAGLLVFGVGAFFVGRLTAGPGDPAAPQPVGASAAPSLGVYEQSQVVVNQAKFAGALAPLTQAWLPYLSGCDRSGAAGGPGLNRGEKTRVRCRFDGMSVVFVEYASIADRDKARVKILSQNVDARTLTPGVGAAGERAAPSGRTSGNYVEFAYTVDENKRKQTVAGIWWDDAATPVAAYMLGFWQTGVGESWAPMREVWARYA